MSSKLIRYKKLRYISLFASCELIPLAPGKMDLRKSVISHFPSEFLKRYLDHPKAHLPLYPNMTPVSERQHQGRGYLLVTTRCKHNLALTEFKLMREYSTWFPADGLNRPASVSSPQSSQMISKIQKPGIEHGNSAV